MDLFEVMERFIEKLTEAFRKAEEKLKEIADKLAEAFQDDCEDEPDPDGDVCTGSIYCCYMFVLRYIRSQMREEQWMHPI